MPAVRKGLQALPFESVFRAKFSAGGFVTGPHGECDRAVVGRVAGPSSGRRRVERPRHFVSFVLECQR